MTKEFGERLLHLLQQKEMSQKELASILEVTEATISRYISGEREPKTEILANIATALGTTSDYLLGLENNLDFSTVKGLLARNIHKMTAQEKTELIKTLFGE